MESLLGVLVSTLLLLPAVSAQGCAAVTSRFSPRMGSGYTARVIATGLSQPRHIALDSAGNLLVAEGGSGSVRRLVLRDDGSNVCVASTSVVTSDRSVCNALLLGRRLRHH